jgi:hypothetical protein
LIAQSLGFFALPSRLVRFHERLFLRFLDGFVKSLLGDKHEKSLLMFYYFSDPVSQKTPGLFSPTPPTPTFTAKAGTKSSLKSELLIVLFIIYIYILYLTCYIHVVRE